MNNKCSATWDNGSCDRVSYAKNLCVTHNWHFRQGHTFRPIKTNRPLGLEGVNLAQWCLDKNSILTEDCRIWQGNTNPSGYGIITTKSRQVFVHRLIIECFVINRTLLRDEFTHHICSNKSCINPSHLQLVTHYQNVAEMLERKSLKSYIAFLENSCKEKDAEIAFLRGKLNV